MFSQPASSRLAASSAATEQTKSYETLLAARIALQKILDAGNKLPGKNTLSKAKNASDEVIEAHHKLTGALETTLGTLTSLLSNQTAEGSTSTSSSSSKKRSLSWEEVQAPQRLLRPKWEATLDKWNARLHFGTEAKKSKLKMFNSKIFEQIAVAMQDQQRSFEKSRMPLAESGRLDKHLDTTSENNKNRQNRNNDDDDDNDEDSDDEDSNNSSSNVKKGSNGKIRQQSYDHEVYDDRALYSLLLKTWIQSAAADSSGMRADDLAALRKYRRSKAEVDRRASKGRKIRYIPHAKLQNFMFPVQLPEAPMDVDRLFQSLFQ